MLKHGILETTGTIGSGAIFLAPVAGRARVSDRFSVGEVMDYLITDQNGNCEWGIGTVANGNSLIRTKITGTLIEGVYTANGSPLNLSGTASVECVEHEGSHQYLSETLASFVALGTQTDSFGISTGKLVDEAGSVLPVLVVNVTTPPKSFLVYMSNDYNYYCEAELGTDPATPAWRIVRRNHSTNELQCAGASCDYDQVAIDLTVVSTLQYTSGITSNLTQHINNNATLGVAQAPDASWKDSIILGQNAGRNWVRGDLRDNCFIGSESGFSCSTGYNNTFVGSAGHFMTTGYNNTALGADAMRGTTGFSIGNTAIGVDALQGDGSAYATYNYATAIGLRAGAANKANEALTIGVFSGENQTTGSYNTQIGSYAARNLTTANRCTAIGYAALGYGALINGVGDNNVAIGYQALYHALGQHNTVVGTNAAYAAGAYADKNTALGHQSMHDLSSGYANTYVGSESGYNVQGTHYNTGIGYNAGPAEYGRTSTICIGAWTKATADNQCVIGSSNPAGKITNIFIGQGVTTASPAGITINATGGSGTDNPGGPLILSGGRATGSAKPGPVILQSSTTAGSGASPQLLAPRVQVDANGLHQWQNNAEVIPPGPGIGLLRWEEGTASGTLKLVAYAGTSSTGVTVVDNVGL